MDDRDTSRPVSWNDYVANDERRPNEISVVGVAPRTLPRFDLEKHAEPVVCTASTSYATRATDQEATAMCRLLNKHHASVPASAVCIGRGSKWGDPFRIGTRQRARPPHSSQTQDRIVPGISEGRLCESILDHDSADSA